MMKAKATLSKRSKVYEQSMETYCNCGSFCSSLCMCSCNCVPHPGGDAAIRQGTFNGNERTGSAHWSNQSARNR